jgi:pterin-4a-carbinolamine dehydratase
MDTQNAQQTKNVASEGSRAKKLRHPSGEQSRRSSATRGDVRARRWLEVEERLKAERVQEKLRAMPGWTAAGRGRRHLERVWELPDNRIAMAFVQLVNELSAHHRMTTVVRLVGAQVSVTLRGKGGRGAHSGVTDAMLDFAQMLG